MESVKRLHQEVTCCSHSEPNNYTICHCRTANLSNAVRIRQPKRYR